MKALELINLQKQYQNKLSDKSKKATYALKGISLSVEQGEFFGLLGPNGAGKSTAIGIVASLVNKTDGIVKVFGHDIDSDLLEAKSKIGLVPQEINFNVFETPFDIVVNQGGYYGLPYKKASERAEYYLKKLLLWGKAFQPARTLSGGMKRRLMIARSMIHEPQLLLLDEPTAGVDIEIKRHMWSFLTELNAKGCTIILTTHNLEEAEYLCRNIAIINHGRIIEQSSTKTLVRKLNKETLILDLASPLLKENAILKFAPLALKGFHFHYIDELTIEVSFSTDCILNNLFTELNNIGCYVRSLRNKANRLEELFLELVSDSSI